MQVVVPDMLASKAPNQRWGFFKLLQRLAPTTQAGALHRAHFGVGGAAAGQQAGGGTRLAAAAQIFAWKNRLHNKVRKQHSAWHGVARSVWAMLAFNATELGPRQGDI